jgi:hypothetical protein
VQTEGNHNAAREGNHNALPAMERKLKKLKMLKEGRHRMIGPEVGIAIEEFRKNLTGISREFHGNCMYFW